MGRLTPEYKPGVQVVEVAVARDTREVVEGYAPHWIELHHRYLRSLVPTRYGLKSGDPKLEKEYIAVNGNMDSLLEDYHAEILSKTALEGVPHEQIIADHAERVQEDGKATE